MYVLVFAALALKDLSLIGVISWLQVRFCLSHLTSRAFFACFVLFCFSSPTLSRSNRLCAIRPFAKRCMIENSHHFFSLAVIYLCVAIVTDFVFSSSSFEKERRRGEETRLGCGLQRPTL